MNLEHPLTNADAGEASTNQPTTYEAPAIESVLTPESLEREVHYAGISTGSDVSAA